MLQCCRAVVNPPSPPALTDGDITLNVTSSDNPSVFGEPVTFTVYIDAQHPFPNANVTGKVRHVLCRQGRCSCCFTSQMHACPTGAPASTAWCPSLAAHTTAARACPVVSCAAGCHPQRSCEPPLAAHVPCHSAFIHSCAQVVWTDLTTTSNLGQVAVTPTATVGESVATYTSAKLNAQVRCVVRRPGHA